MKLLGISVINLASVKKPKGGFTSRVFLANSFIRRSFSIGDFIKAEGGKGIMKIDLATQKQKTHTVSYRKSDKKLEPIIDIKNSNVTETFIKAKKIKVKYYKNKIIVRIAKTARSERHRQNKNGLNVFEIFSSFGSLSHFFKKYGCNIIGGLEYTHDTLKQFVVNNHEEVYTILGDIKDVELRDYPKNIDIVLTGYPCTDFTKGNKKLREALANKKAGLPYDEEPIKRKEASEALVFYVMNSIREMNPKTCIIEEVPEFKDSFPAQVMRTLFSQWGYNMTETVDVCKHTMRKRWVMISTMGRPISLKNLIEDDGKTIGDFLDQPWEERNWKKLTEIKRLHTNSKKKSIGIRCCTPFDSYVNTFTSHGTRGTEPSIKHPHKNLYSEFTNTEIQRIHGLDGMILSGVKTRDRAMLGMGVGDMFDEVARRVVSEHYNSSSEPILKTAIEDSSVDLTAKNLTSSNTKHENIKQISLLDLMTA